MKILATDGFSDSGVTLLKEAGHELIIKNIAANQLSNFINTHLIEGILVKSTTPLTEYVLSEINSLKFIGICDRSSTSVAKDFASQNGIKVFEAEDAWSNSVAELTIAHLLSCIRYLKDSNREMPLEGDHKFNALKRSFSGGSELKGKTLGIIGFDKIGQEVAKKAIALGMSVKYYDKTIKSAEIQLNFFDKQSLGFQLNVTE